MKRLLLALLILWPTLAFAQTPTPVLQKFPGWKLCEDGRIGSDCVSVGPMPALAGPLSCALQADSTPFDNCVTAPTPVPTATPSSGAATPTPNPPGGSSGNLQTNNGTGGFGAYAGATCPTPGFAISSDASGGWTCATPVAPTPQPTATPGAGSGDITDVWSCTSGDCAALTAAAGDTFDAGSADSTNPCKEGTTAPATCSVGECFFDTDATAGSNLLGCTATDTWTTQGGGGGITGSLTDGRVTLSSGAASVTDDSALTFDRTNNRLAITGATTATDNTAWMFGVTGTLPPTPSTTVRGVGFDITSAGSASLQHFAFQSQLLAGYTGNQVTAAIHARNLALGTGATLNLGVTGASPDANHGGGFTVDSGGSTTTGINLGMRGIARYSTTANVGAIGKADSAVAGSNIGVLGNASASTEATDVKDIGVLGTLATTLPNENRSAAGYFDGGTLTDATTHVMRLRGTFPASPSAGADAVPMDFTTAGSASQQQRGIVANMLAGYTGSSGTASGVFVNSAAGTGTTLNLGSSASTNHTANLGTRGLTNGSTGGVNIGNVGQAQSSTARNVGVFGGAAGTAAG